MFELERPPIETLRATVSGAKVTIRRSRWPRLLLTAAVGIAVGLWLSGIYQDAAKSKARWQTEIDGWTAVKDLQAGTTLTEDDLVATRLPQAGTPRDATLSNPLGLTLRDDIAAGEIIRDGRLSKSNSQLAAQLDNNKKGLTIANDGTPLSSGDLVDLHSLIDGTRLAARAVVIEVTEGFLTVAIAEQQIPTVIRSLTTGGVVPVLVG